MKNAANKFDENEAKDVANKKESENINYLMTEERESLHES
jgi:hypothetical protein